MRIQINGLSFPVFPNSLTKPDPALVPITGRVQVASTHVIESLLGNCDSALNLLGSQVSERFFFISLKNFIFSMGWVRCGEHQESVIALRIR